MTIDSRAIFRKLAGAVAYVSVELPNGDQQIGSAFHVGGGTFVTARHVVDMNTIRKVATPGSLLEVVGNALFHDDASIDVALIRTRLGEGQQQIPTVLLGGHLDDWIDDGLILSPALVLGYPPIPFSKEPLLVAVRADVNAVVDKYTGGHPHFVMSSMARGGFSGGLVYSEFDFALGMVTESLGRNNEPPELGFFSVLTIEPIFVCLEQHGLLRKVQDAGFGPNTFSFK